MKRRDWLSKVNSAFCSFHILPCLKIEISRNTLISSANMKVKRPRKEMPKTMGGIFACIIRDEPIIRDDEMIEKDILLLI